MSSRPDHSTTRPALRRPALRLDWCTYEAAAFACRHWHYSGSVPGGGRVMVGVWEGGLFTGCVIFSSSANQTLGQAYGLTQFQTPELSRVALREHAWPVTRIIAIAIRLLRRHCPGLRLVVSYADTEQGHHGGIYAGGGWLYLGLVEVGRASGTASFRIHGQMMHPRTVYQRGWRQQLSWLRRYIDPKAEAVYPMGKHKYLYPLCRDLATRLRPLHQPYPKPIPAPEALLG